MTIGLAAAAGCLLGAAYVGWLWIDVRRIVEHLGDVGSRRGRMRPGQGTAFLRLAGVGVALVVISRTGSPNLLAALASMMLVRTILVWRVGRPGHA